MLVTQCIVCAKKCGSDMLYLTAILGKHQSLREKPVLTSGSDLNPTEIEVLVAQSTSEFAGVPSQFNTNTAFSGSLP